MISSAGEAIANASNAADVKLFTRSRAGMTLTAAGRALAARVPTLLSRWDIAFRKTQAAARMSEKTLHVGFLAAAANEATPEIVAEFARRRPGWKTRMRQADWGDPSAGLAQGLVEAAILRLPVPDAVGLHIRELFSEPRWVILSAAHRLTGRDRIAASTVAWRVGEDADPAVRDFVSCCVDVIAKN
ncbi:LysR family transcriptional regulator [Catenulispora sp. GAS73]|uniref:LysR family transcriptional regulator n=1 Tax=Catenulispora sp. GAS73 TaxID=3156269 RepID=UPI0035155542